MDEFYVELRETLNRLDHRLETGKGFALMGTLVHIVGALIRVSRALLERTQYLEAEIHALARTQSTRENDFASDTPDESQR